MKLIFLLEEPSMKYFLNELLPRILPENVAFQLIPHHGKRDLEKSIPKKLRGWNEPGDIRFVILHDQDNKDCIELKQSLLELCKDTDKPVLVRIACQELELNEQIPSPKEALYKLIPEHQQIEGARRIAPCMDTERNTSVSFQMFISGIRKFVEP